MRLRTQTPVATLAFLGLSILAPAAGAQRPSAAKPSVAPPPLQAPLSRDAHVRTAPRVQPPKASSADARRVRDQIPRDQLYFGESASGAPQVRGHTYKAEFGTQAATYTPYCGPQAPRSHPLSFRLQSITAGGEPIAFASDVAAQRAGTSVRYARGGVQELYDLNLDSIEQKFVFETLPATGELVVRIACASDMSAAYGEGGIVFTSADGSVRYGAATVLDARGASAPAQLELDGQSIGIHVSADFLARASFPITIDPLVTTFGVLWGSTIYDDFAPAIAWDETNQRYCTVCEEVFSGTDDDVIYVFSDGAGNFIQADYINLGGDFWAAPDVADNFESAEFYVVAAVGDPAGGLRTIRGKLLNAGSGLQGTDTEISVGTTGEDILPSVGGDPFPGSIAYFTVVWENLKVAGVDTDILCQQVDQVGALFNPLRQIDTSLGTLDHRPRVSKSCLNVGLHHVVWQRDVAPGDSDVYGAELNFDGTILIASAPIVTGGNTTAPACSPVDNLNTWLLVYEYDFFTDHDVVGARMTGLTVNNTLNLSEREDTMGTGTLFEDQVRPAADTDGVHFSYSYAESNPSTPGDYDVYVSSLDYIGAYLRVGEFHVVLANNGTHEDFPRMCSQQTIGGSGNRMGIVWSNDTVGAPDFRDVNAAIYATGDFTKMCSASWDGVGSCPCANTSFLLGRGCDNSSATGGASLDGSGEASLASDTVVFTTFGERPTAPSILAQGNALIAGGATFGQGLRCAGGSLKRMYVHSASGGSITAPSGLDLPVNVRSAALADPLSPGVKRYYFVYYRDPFVLGGCPLSSGFNSTDTVQVVWRP